MKKARIFKIDYETRLVTSEPIEQPEESTTEDTITTPYAEILVTVFLPAEFGRGALDEVLNTFEAGLRGM